MIHYFSPYSPEKNLGKAYNDACRLVPDGDWICLTDGDVMFLTSDYGRQLIDIVKRYPGTGLFTCLTNRVGELRQCYGGKISEKLDLRYHKAISESLQKSSYYGIKPANHFISGFFMLFSKETWNRIQFPESPGRILGVDNDFSAAIIKAGKDIKILTGVYVFHQYRILKGVSNKEHLK